MVHAFDSGYAVASDFDVARVAVPALVEHVRLAMHEQWALLASRYMAHAPTFLDPRDTRYASQELLRGNARPTSTTGTGSVVPAPANLGPYAHLEGEDAAARASAMRRAEERRMAFLHTMSALPQYQHTPAFVSGVRV